MTIMHVSHHTDVSTVNYSSLHTQRKLRHCVTDVKRQYPIAPLFRGDLGMCRQCVYQALFSSPTQKSLGMRLTEQRTQAHRLEQPVGRFSVQFFLVSFLDMCVKSEVSYGIVLINGDCSRD